MAEVTLENITKRFGTTEIIPDLTLTVRDGELFTIVGPSGCGKSTLLHLIAGLDPPTSGRILFDGQDVTELPPRERDVAMVFQSYALYPHMTVAENLSFPLRVARRKSGLDRRQITEELRRVAELLGLGTVLERRPRELSGGQRQRVALGRALIRKPRVFLLDEPLSNLDAQLRAGMRAELRRLHDDLQITMIYVTHDQTEAMTLADRLAVLDGGRLQQVGTPQDLYARPANLFVAQFIGSPPMNLLDGLVQGGRIRAGPINVPIPSDVRVVPEGERVTLGIRPEEIHVEKASTSSEQVASPGSASLGVIRLVEPTGGHTWVTVEVAGPDGAGTLVGLADRKTKAKPGDRVAVSLVGAACQLFDSRTGRHLGAAHD